MKKAYLLGSITVLCWSTMAPVCKSLMGTLTDMEVLFYGCTVATIVLFLMIALKGELSDLKSYGIKHSLYRCFLGFIGFFLYSALYYHGIALLPAQIACILNYLWPIFTVCFSCIILKERFSLVKFFALLLSFGGVIVVTFHPGDSATSTSSLIGYASCLIGAALYGVFSVLNKKEGGNQLVNMFLYIGTSAVCSGICCAVVGFSPLQGFQIPGLLWVGVVANALGYWLWAVALQMGSSASIANLAYLTPVLSLFMSHFLIGEPLYVTSFIGLGLILFGFFLQMYMDKQ